MKEQKKLTNILLGAVLISNAMVQSSRAQDDRDPFTDGGYQLVWSDEFNQDGSPDPKNWNFEEGFVRNNEAQWYQKENAVVKGGMLYITGREDIKRNPAYVKGSTDPGETKFIEYTSSSLMTKGLHSWTMGRFVMRAKSPHGEGMWPAFWTVGDKGTWPSNGEIDILEYYQDMFLANVVSGTDKPWQGNWSSKKYKTSELGGEKWLDEFHVWRMDWDKESIRLYVDDQLLNETKLADTYNTNLEWGPKNPFHHPQFIIINLALGGNGGDMEKAKLPAEYIIDYVRVYQREEDRMFKPSEEWIPPAPYTGKKVGIHHFSELPKTLNKKCSWTSGADSRCYAWKPPGQDRESVQMMDDSTDPFEGSNAYKFVLNHSWSRWMIEMDPAYGDGVADLSDFEKMGFAVQSKDAADWEQFRVIIESSDGKAYEAPMQDLGFKPDGKWHPCVIKLDDVERAGVDLKKIRTLFAIGWEGGVSNGQYFKLDDLHVE